MSPLDLLFAELETGKTHREDRRVQPRRDFESESRVLERMPEAFTWVRTGEAGAARGRLRAVELQGVQDRRRQDAQVDHHQLQRAPEAPFDRGGLEAALELRRDGASTRSGERGHAHGHLREHVGHQLDTFDLLFAMLMWQTMDVLCNDSASAIWRKPRPTPRALHPGRVRQHRQRSPTSSGPSRSCAAATSPARSSCSHSPSSKSHIRGRRRRRSPDCCDTLALPRAASRPRPTERYLEAGRQADASRRSSVNDSRGSNSIRPRRTMPTGGARPHTTVRGRAAPARRGHRDDSGNVPDARPQVRARCASPIPKHRPGTCRCQIRQALRLPQIQDPRVRRRWVMRGGR